MAKTPKIFISYNPKALEEETLAVRLQTIGAVNGFDTFLPDRFSENVPRDSETIRRIKLSDYFVMFASHNISRAVQDEIDIAFEHFNDPSKIIIIYNQHQVQSPGVENPNTVTLIPFDPSKETVDKVISKVVARITTEEYSKSNQETTNGLLALLGIGLGLLALAAIFSGED